MEIKVGDIFLTTSNFKSLPPMYFIITKIEEGYYFYKYLKSISYTDDEHEYKSTSRHLAKLLEHKVFIKITNELERFLFKRMNE